MGNSPDTYTQMLPQLSEILTQALTTKMQVKMYIKKLGYQFVTLYIDQSLIRAHILQEQIGGRVTCYHI